MSSGAQGPSAAGEGGLLSQTAVYTAFRVINAGLPVLLVPILTRHMTPTDYGVMSSLSLAVSILAPAVGFGMTSVVRRRYFDRDELDFGPYLLSALCVFATSLLIVTPLCLLVHGLFGFGATVPTVWVFALLLWVAGQVLRGFHLTLLQLEGRSRAFGLTTVLGTVVNLLVSLGLVVALEMGWRGRALGPVAAYVATGVLAVATLTTHIKPSTRPRWDYVKDALRFAAPTIPLALVQRAVAATDRLVVIAMLGLSIGGEYAVGSQVAAVLNVLAQSFITAWTPWLYARLKVDDGPARVAVVRATYGAVLGLALAGLALCALVDVALPMLVGPAFVAAGRFVPWLVAAFVIRNTGTLLMGIIVFREKHAIMAWVSIVSGALNYPLSVFFVSRYGANGAAQATCVIFGMTLLLTAVVATRVQSLPWLRPFARFDGRA